MPSHKRWSENYKKYCRNCWGIPPWHQKHWWICKPPKHGWNSMLLCDSSFLNHWQKRSTEDHKCRASSFHCSFNSRGKENVFSAFRLPPILVCKHLVNRPPGKYPFGMQVLASKSGKWKGPWRKKPMWTTSGRKGQVGFSTQESPLY